MKTQQHTIAIAIAGLSTALCLTAHAQESAGGSASFDTASLGAPAGEAREEDALLYERGGLSGVGLSLGAKVGLGFSQNFSDLGTSPVAELELGYNLPVLDRSLGFFFSGQYSQPGSDEKEVADTLGPDGGSRLPDTFSYEVQQQQAILTLGLHYRVPLSVPLFRPYLAAGARAYLMKTKIQGESGGQPFGENEETATAFGPYGALGAELHLGPGAVLLEVQLGWAKLDGFVMRDTNVGALNTLLGYRLFI